MEIIFFLTVGFVRNLILEEIPIVKCKVELGSFCGGTSYFIDIDLSEYSPKFGPSIHL